MTHRATETLLVYNIVLLILVLPFYIYGLSKWILFRRHILISKRFPAISNCIIVITLISTFTYTIRIWIEYNEGHQTSAQDSMILRLIGSSGSANAFFIASMAAYRLFLVYLRWKRFQRAVDDINQTDFCEHDVSVVSVNDNDSDSNKRKNVYKHYASALFIIYIFIGYIINLFRKEIDLFRNSVSIMWTTWILMVIVLIIVIKYKHVTEGIGCLRETYITLLYVIMGFIFSRMEHDIFDYFKTTLLPFPALISIYISLYYIKKFEGSLDAIKWNKNHETPPIHLTKMRTTSDITIVIQHENNDNIADDVNQITKTNQVISDLELPLFLFLTKQENYKAFTAYLAHCFCLENILFYERVCILYEIVNEYKKSESQKRTFSEDIYTNDQQKAIERVKFSFLQQIYFEYTNKINKLNMKYNKIDSKDIESIDYYKKALYKIYQSIFNEFVGNDSKNEINISAETRLNLQYLFNADSMMMDKFKSFDDFLYVFDSALIEICQLLLGIYGYRFKQWAINNL